MLFNSIITILSTLKAVNRSFSKEKKNINMRVIWLKVFFKQRKQLMGRLRIL
jgi:hypothetical protein